MNRIDRQKVKRAFHAHASSYEQYATVQKEIVRRQRDLLQKEGVKPAMVLDIGCGTGMLLREMIELFPGAGTVGVDLALGMAVAAEKAVESTSAGIVNADAEKLPFPSDSFELVASTSTFQWLQGFNAAFSEVFRVLSSRGFFFFSLFGAETLYELRHSYKLACRHLGKGCEGRVHSFSGPDEVGSVLEEVGFVNVRLFSELVVETHTDVSDLLRSLKMIGAGNASPGEGAKPANRQVMLEMMRIYRSEYGWPGGGIPATYDVIYGIAEKA